MGFKEFVKNDVGKLASFATNPKTVGGTMAFLSFASFCLNAVKEKNDRAALKMEIMNEMGDEIVEQAMTRAMNKLSGSK